MRCVAYRPLRDAAPAAGGAPRDRIPAYHCDGQSVNTRRAVRVPRCLRASRYTYLASHTPACYRITAWRRPGVPARTLHVPVPLFTKSVTATSPPLRNRTSIGSHGAPWPRSAAPASGAGRGRGAPRETIILSGEVYAARRPTSRRHRAAHTHTHTRRITYTAGGAALTTM